MPDTPKEPAPKAYQQGWIEFYKLKFMVNEDVLIPRPETELLVDEVLSYAKTKAQSQDKSKNESPDQTSPLEILDLGTGAGAIAISVAKNLKDCHITATEVSPAALAVAKKNAQLHGVSEQIDFVVADLLSGLEQIPDFKQPEIIVTNLPYIPAARIPYLDSSVKDYEPHVALNGGEDGFELYRQLFQQINDKGWKPKLIIGEIDYTHFDIAYAESVNYFPNAQAEVKKDLYHQQRILIIKF